MRDFNQAGRIVIKVGTAILTKNDSVDTEYIQSLACQIAELIKEKRSVALVTSGAIGMGAGALNLKGPIKDLKMRQACAAIGMPLLMNEYYKAFFKHGIIVAQVLLTAEVLNERRSYLNLRNSMEKLLKLGVMPILNENDCVSTKEIGTAFGDNDKLSALVASKLDADLLIVLTDIDGLYDKNPRKYNNAKPVKIITEITPDIENMADEYGSTHSTGGMKTKIQAAKIAANAGYKIVLANGREQNIIRRIIAGEDLGTLFLPKRKLTNRQRWILNSKAEGTIKIDEGAMSAIRQKKSLLPSGIVQIKKQFNPGSVVIINDKAKAVTSLGSAELERLAGHHSSEIRKTLGMNRKDVVANPEDIVFFED
ncbi:MAG TPA: glutamate 5-kinase [Candidatus Marinimicrobia bacterium]|nr:glutamate 5-kinase [Candidatus Neomarinimicrobiota bacterium]